MQRMVLQRILIGLVTLWVVSVLVFLMTNALPGDVAQIVLGQSATPESLAAYRAETGSGPTIGISIFQLAWRLDDR